MDYEKHSKMKEKKRVLETTLFLILSGRRDSNPRPRPWQGRALPAELLSRNFQHFSSALLANGIANLAKGFEFTTSI